MATQLKARVLVATVINGHALQPNNVVLINDKQLKAHSSDLDADEVAIAAAVEAGGVEVDVSTSAQKDDSADQKTEQ